MIVLQVRVVSSFSFWSSFYNVRREGLAFSFAFWCGIILVMKIKVFIAVLAGKAIRALCRMLKKGGTGEPGKIALKLCPGLLSVLSSGVNCIIVTGTNGKTTTCRIVEEGLKKAGLSYFANRSGANLIEGIATEFIVNSSLSGKCRYSYAVLETDEAASKEVCRYLQPSVILVTNIFLDQVDRFGGVEHTRDWIKSGILNAPGAAVCINADCCVSSSLAIGIPNKTVFYGIEKEAVAGRAPGGSSDVSACPVCGADIDLDYRVFSHLGGFICPECGFSRTAPDYGITAITDETLSSTEFICNGRKLTVNLPAMYNVYNAAGAMSALIAAGISEEDAASALSDFEGSFGRMESLNLGKKGAKMILVKNGAGCDQVIDFVQRINDRFTLSIYLNNNISDGVDISWLKDVRFESLNNCDISKIYVSGMRMEEMYQRLVSAGIPQELLIKEPDCSKLISSLNESEYPVIIMPTYTGMMETRSEIVRQCGGKEYWET